MEWVGVEEMPTVRGEAIQPNRMQARRLGIRDFAGAGRQHRPGRARALAPEHEIIPHTSTPLASSSLYRV
jgi:hypothetical protein